MYSETILEYSRKCFHSVWGHLSLITQLIDHKDLWQYAAAFDLQNYAVEGGAEQVSFIG